MPSPKDIYEILLETLMMEFPPPWRMDHQGCVIDKEGSVVCSKLSREQAVQVINHANSIESRQREMYQPDKALFGKPR